MCKVEVVLALGYMIRILVAKRETQSHGTAFVVDQVEAGEFRFFPAIEREGGFGQWLSGADEP